MTIEGVTPGTDPAGGSEIGAVVVLDAAFSALYCRAEDQEGKNLAEAVFATGAAIEELVHATEDAEATIRSLMTEGFTRQMRRVLDSLRRLRAARAAVVAPSHYFTTTKGARPL